ncbi:adenosylcobinamide-GDP ribazoletransferase [Pelagimonas varians]|uniref:Adenosylcobinamide-GDP ribazoletransferase n=1 Tax=Pelagimonas varians TaxID=696760 RepID=A0A238K6U8_9RHOB|nr:adenosylcobinamide-GDP ribazoletransferase [Pelagimonas varians]PYG31822.1 cobalamin-5'-phosphate synthase [Pelagimonas varians]SMX38535.1 Cobalamin synthase [Pelagimonas varians]
MTLISRRISELRLAGMLLTRVPMGTLRDPVPDLPDARWAYPLVGLCLGICAGLIACIGAAIGFNYGITALLVVALCVLITGGLHEDGMADLADGFGGGHTPARRLEIMRDSRIGSYGVLALGLALALKTQAMFAVFSSGSVFWPLVALAALSRFFMLAVQEFLPPARSDGMGFKAHKRGGWRIWIGLATALVVAFPLGWSLFAVVAAMALASAALAWQAKRLVGGQTGDVLGAVQLAADCAGWLALSLFV